MGTLPYRRACVQCGRDFYPCSSINRFCSSHCAQRSQREKRPTVSKPFCGKDLACIHCGSVFQQKTPQQKYCSKACYKAANQPSPETYAPFRIYERDFFRCVYCGRSSIEHGVVLHADHVVSRHQGGRDIAGNLVTSCDRCNVSKGSKELKPSVIHRVLLLVAYRNAERGLKQEQVIKMTLLRSSEITASDVTGVRDAAAQNLAHVAKGDQP